MKTFMIDKETNDLVLDESMNFVMIEDDDEEEQSIRLLLSTNAGEWFLNVLHGLPYEYFQTKQFDQDRARLELISTLNQEPRVKEIVEIRFDLDHEKRKLTIYVKVAMDSGRIMESEVTV
ncbi:DUF2634 domain-containing protein [Anaerosolibacter sp.]|uniref:DUF2634 domain-containing protein n=1 Tax=Anaerosolibacter sp. TaxID=1872527 RepID=UPI0039EF6892